MTSPDPSRPEALRRIAAIDAEAYARTRNALDGAVTGLSPWITHGIVTPAEVLAGAIAAHAAAGRRTPIGLQHRLVMELGWREYFRHVWHHRGDAILRSLHEGVLPGAAYADARPVRDKPGDIGNGPLRIAEVFRLELVLFQSFHSPLAKRLLMPLDKGITHGMPPVC